MQAHLPKSFLFLVFLDTKFRKYYKMSAAEQQTPVHPPKPSTSADNGLFSFLEPSTPIEDAKRPEITHPRASIVPAPLNTRSSAASIASKSTTDTLYRRPSVPPPPFTKIHQTASPYSTSTADKKLGYSFDTEASLNDFLKPRLERANIPSYPTIPPPTRPQTPYNAPPTDSNSTTGSSKIAPRKPVPVRTTATFNRGDYRASKPFGFSYYAPTPSFASAPANHDLSFKSARAASPAPGSPAPSSTVLPGFEQAIPPTPAPNPRRAEPSMAVPVPAAALQGPAVPPPTALGAQPRLPLRVQEAILEDMEGQNKKRGPWGFDPRVFWGLVGSGAVLALVIIVVVLVAVVGKQKTDYAQS